MGESPKESCDGLIAPAGEAEDLPPTNGDEDDDVNGQEEEGVEPLRKETSPTMPPAAGVEEHHLTHVPCRSWCTGLCMGRGLREQRGAPAGRTHEIPFIGIDFGI